MKAITEHALAQVNGGLSWAGIKSLPRTVYREAVKDITAGFGGWQLANQMYGNASWGEKWRAMKAFKGYLDAGDKLPSWAPNW